MNFFSRHTRWLWVAALLCLVAPASRAQESRAQESSDIQVPPTPVPGAVGDEGPPPWRYGLSVGVRGEVDVLGLGATTALIPGVSLGYTRQKLGGALTVLVQRAPGLRLEGQFHPLTLGWVRPYARLGATAFFAELDAQGEHTFLGGVGGRGTLGVDVQCTSRVYAFADVSYEHFLTGGDRYRQRSVLFSLGVGLFP